MFVPSEVKKCVAFIVLRMADGTPRFVGTLFLVGRKITGSERSFAYAVTAKHVIEGIKSKGLQEVFIRYNTVEGKAKFVRAPADSWVTHPTDSAADVAVLPLTFPPDADHLMYPVERFLSAELIAAHRIDAGDEVFVTGLFAPHFGAQRNVPILRVGNIAAMPEQPVYSPIGPIDAYLIESRSIGGLSGSPVFVNLGVTRWFEDGIKHSTGGPIYFLMGLMHGHWDLGVEDTGSSKSPSGVAQVNMGVAIVVPAEKILETLNRGDLLATEQSLIEKLVASGEIHLT